MQSTTISNDAIIPLLVDPYTKNTKNDNMKRTIHAYSPNSPSRRTPFYTQKYHENCLIFLNKYFEPVSYFKHRVRDYFSEQFILQVTKNEKEMSIPTLAIIYDKSIFILDYTKQKVLNERIQSLPSPIYCGCPIEMSNNGEENIRNEIALGTNACDGRLYIVSNNEDNEIEEYRIGKSIYSMNYSKPHDYILLGTFEGTIEGFGRRKRKIIFTYTVSMCPIYNIARISDEQFILGSTQAKCCLNVLQTHSKSPYYSIPKMISGRPGRDNIVSMCLMKGEGLLTGSTKGHLKLWDLNTPTFRSLRTFRPCKHWIYLLKRVAPGVVSLIADNKVMKLILIWNREAKFIAKGGATGALLRLL